MLKRYMPFLILVLTASSLHAGAHDAGNGSGQMVLSVGDEIIEVEGECTDWNFLREQDGNSPYVVSILVNLDRETGSTVAGLGSAMINLGDVFWAFELKGEVDHTESTYAFSGFAKNLKAPQDEPVPASIKVTCG
ncbi:MAG: hypothetical protein AAFN76_11995 [Pseudomonadota bacterium]